MFSTRRRRRRPRPEGKSITEIFLSDGFYRTQFGHPPTKLHCGAVENLLQNKS